MGLLEPELHVRVLGPEALDHSGDQPRAQRELEGDRDCAGARVDELAHGSQAVVEAVQHRVHVVLEHRAGVRRAEQASAPVQQR